MSLTSFVKTIIVKMNNFGQKIKSIIEYKGAPLRIVANQLGIDQAILSKIENGKRKATKKQFGLIAEYFKISTKELIIDWLSNKIIYDEGKEYGYEALKVAEEQIIYLKVKR